MFDWSAILSAVLKCCSVLDQNVTVGLPFRDSLFAAFRMFYLAPSVSGLTDDCSQSPKLMLAKRQMEVKIGFGK